MKPKAFLQTVRRANKPHICCECLCSIRVGDRYEFVSGVWESGCHAFRTCTSCSEIRDDCSARTGEPCPFGDLANCIQELFHEGFGPLEYARAGSFAPERVTVLFPSYDD